MEGLNYNISNISDDLLNAAMQQLWSKRDYDTANFYTTGFETIIFNRDPSFVLKTVLSSSVGFENELLIIGNGHTGETLCRTANEQNLTFHYFDIFSYNWSQIENLLYNRAHISHLLVGIDSDTPIEQIPVINLLHLTSTHKCSLIVYSESSVDALNDIFGGAIDFMICGLTNEPPVSFLVARRSQLVQTEGNSNSLNFDLYSYWQWSMRDRTPIIEPMRV
ncbi:MAG: hypothetical protein FWH18_05425 [Marinilabiliaceae bacterium]|nr:hypothetical protein [Marinilabiliaceae bacterium]